MLLVMGIVHFDERPGIFNEFFAERMCDLNAGARGSWRARRLYHFQLFGEPYAENLCPIRGSRGLRESGQH